VVENIVLFVAVPQMKVDYHTFKSAKKAEYQHLQDKTIQPYKTNRCRIKYLNTARTKDH
jgi:hypothetical protein